MPLMPGRCTTLLLAWLIHSWLGMVMIIGELGMFLVQRLIWVVVMVTALFGTEVHSDRAFRLLPWITGQPGLALRHPVKLPKPEPVHPDPPASGSANNAGRDRSRSRLRKGRGCGGESRPWPRLSLFDLHKPGPSRDASER
jgi:hypothetical protein